MRFSAKRTTDAARIYMSHYFVVEMQKLFLSRRRLRVSLPFAVSPRMHQPLQCRLGGLHLLLLLLLLMLMWSMELDPQTARIDSTRRRQVSVTTDGGRSTVGVEVR